MMKFLRSQSQTVLVLILVVIGGSFLFYGNVGNLLTGSSGRGSDFGSIDGQTLSVAELEDQIRITRDGLLMNGRAQQLNQPDGRAALAREAWHQLLLLHEADRLDIQVTDAELLDYLHQVFQKDGTYSPDLFQKEMTILDGNYHISETAFETFVRNQLRMQAVEAALFSTVRTSTGDLSAQYEKYAGAAQVSVVTFDPKTFASSIKVTPAEIQAEYQAHPDNPAYRTAEKRKVDYVLLPLTPEQAKLPAKDKAAAIEALGEKALDFALSLVPDPTNTDAHASASDFQAEAKKKGLSVATTDFFAADAAPSGMAPSPAFNSAAFSLTKDNPISKVVEMESGVAVLHLNDIQPSELKPLEQVQADISRQLQQSKAVLQAQMRAELAAQSLRTAVARGMSFKDAAAAQKLAVEVVPPTVPMTVSPSDSRLQMIAYFGAQLAVGEVSPAKSIEGTDTFVVCHLDSRAPANPAGLPAFETESHQQQDERGRGLVEEDWVNWMSKQQGTHPPPDLEAYGGVE